MPLSSIALMNTDRVTVRWAETVNGIAVATTRSTTHADGRRIAGSIRRVTRVRQVRQVRRVRRVRRVRT
jgi:hypothetical protein